jgi:hypothetical protein
MIPRKAPSLPIAGSQLVRTGLCLTPVEQLDGSIVIGEMAAIFDDFLSCMCRLSMALVV